MLWCRFKLYRWNLTKYLDTYFIVNSFLESLTQSGLLQDTPEALSTVGNKFGNWESLFYWFWIWVHHACTTSKSFRNTAGRWAYFPHRKFHSRFFSFDFGRCDQGCYYIPSIIAYKYKISGEVVERKYGRPYFELCATGGIVGDAASCCH